VSGIIASFRTRLRKSGLPHNLLMNAWPRTLYQSQWLICDWFNHSIDNQLYCDLVMIRQAEPQSQVRILHRVVILTIIFWSLFSSRVARNVGGRTRPSLTYPPLPILSLPSPWPPLFSPCPSIPLPLKRGLRGSPPENVEILHCRRWVLAHFRSKNSGF